MDKINESSNAQEWYLKVVCRNKAIRDKIVKKLIKLDLIDFETTCLEASHRNDKLDGRYIIEMSCSWFSNLHDLIKELVKIEEKYKDKY